ncbi:hypothetical protein [Inquilinus sp. CA228]|uniref:hypothetical protein n=1 Tax=Inquilinus sp. CA228 TaxID=3455609 RepID=UPI003F8CF5DE
MIRSMDKAHSVSTPQPAVPGLDPERAERAARMLDRFAEMAMEQAEAMHQATLAAAEAGDAAAAKELSLIFDRAGRSLRRSLALQARLARERLEMADRKAAHARDRAEEKTQRRRQVARAVAGSIAGDDGVDAEKGERLTAEMWERLVEDEDIDAELAVLDHPLEEIVIHLCRDIGIRPNPAWLNPDYSGADWSHGREAEGDESGPPGWPKDGPDAGRYWRFAEPGWYDLETCKKLNRPPWELKPDSS